MKMGIISRLSGFLGRDKNGFNPSMDFIANANSNSSLLEIGPYYRPRCEGGNVKYFDILDQNELKERARKEGVPADKLNFIPYIDYVSKAGDLSIVSEKFNALFSSHAIEHQLDFVAHLNMCSVLLVQGGIYYLIVPDKRYCFDHFNQESTIAEIIDANHNKRSKHSMKSVIEHRALTTHNDATRHWNGDHGDVQEGSVSKIKSAIDEYLSKDYVDVHAWYFTPDSFQKIIDQLAALGYIDFEVDQLIPTARNSLEFCVSLRKTN